MAINRYFNNWSVLSIVAMNIRLLISVICLLCSPLLATTYYVANSGSDANNGTASGTPWQTVTNLNAHIALGDTALFHSGDEFTNATHTALYPKGTNYFGVYGGTALAIIDGNTNEGCMAVTNMNQVYFTNIWFKCVISDTNENNQFNGACVYLIGNTASNTKYTNFLFTGCVFTGSTEGIWGEAPSTNFVDGVYNVTITNFTCSNQTANAVQPFTDNESASFTIGPTVKFQFGNWLVTHGLFNHITGDTIQKGSGSAFEMFDCTNCIVEWTTNINSTASNNASGAGGGPVGGFFQMSMGCIAQHNWVYNIHCRFDGTTYQDGEGGFFDSATANCIDQYNYIQGCQGGGHYATSAGSGGGFSNIIRFNIDVTNNTLANTGNNRQGSDMILAFTGNGNQIYNNTVITASNCVDTTQCTGTVTISNNIFATSFPSTTALSGTTTVGNNITPGGNPNWMTTNGWPNANSPAYWSGTHMVNDGGVYFDGSKISPYGVNLGALESTNVSSTNGPLLLPNIGT
jgi:hypothetical protein